MDKANNHQDQKPSSPSIDLIKNNINCPNNMNNGDNNNDDLNNYINKYINKKRDNEKEDLLDSIDNKDNFTKLYILKTYNNANNNNEQNYNKINYNKIAQIKSPKKIRNKSQNSRRTKHINNIDDMNKIENKDISNILNNNIIDNKNNNINKIMHKTKSQDEMCSLTKILINKKINTLFHEITPLK